MEGDGDGDGDGDKGVIWGLEKKIGTELGKKDESGSW